MMHNQNIIQSKVIDLKAMRCAQAERIVMGGGKDQVEFITAAEVLAKDGDAGQRSLGIFILREYRPLRTVQIPINGQEIAAERAAHVHPVTKAFAVIVSMTIAAGLLYWGAL